MRKPQNFQWKEITMGTCYYPEHWEKSQWAEHARLMREAGFISIENFVVYRE